MSRNWIAVASAEHVRVGRGQGFMQVCHGKAAPLKRIQPGDRVICYSPTAIFRAKDGYQHFTSIGIVKPGGPYQVTMGRDFHPFRRDVDWATATETPIKPLLGDLEFAAGRNWGYQLRFGLFSISPHDADLIARAMHADLSSAVEE